MLFSLILFFEDFFFVLFVVFGFFIFFGYVIGGIIFFLLYFFILYVGEGFVWSIGLCLIVLLLFGVGKCWVLRRDGGLMWKRCVFEGV